MSEPTFGSTTEDMWERLPAHFARMDALNDWQMKKYVNLAAAQLQQVDDLIDRIDYNSVSDGGEPDETSELVNPMTADTRWLPWLGQLFGVYVKGNGAESDREQITLAASGYNAGTASAIEAAAKDVLVGTKFTRVYKFATSSGVGTFWDLLLVTIASETLKNLYPEIQATVAETVSWDSTATDATVGKKIVKTEQPVYGKSALEFAMSPDTGTSTTFEAVSSYKFGPITPTDWYQAMITIWSQSNTAYTGTLTLTYYNGSGTPLGTTDQAITLAAGPQQFLVGANAPATAATASIKFTLNNVVRSDKIFVAQLAARHEINDYWIPKTADPVQAVIDKGAKPAGFKLWHGSATSSWSEVLTDNPTWADWEAAGSWEALEES